MIKNNHIALTEISHHYDELDEIYRELWGEHLHHGLWETKSDSKDVAVKQLSYKVLSHLKPLSPKHLIDIGCGYGGTSRIAINLGADEITGVTISEKQFQFARKHSLHYPINYELKDWLQNDFSNCSFDGGFSIECFSHIQDKARFFSEVKRTLKPGSKFVMTAWLEGEKPSQWEKSWLLEPICNEGRLPSLYSKLEVLNEIEKSGLEFIEYEDLSDKVWRTWVISFEEVLGLLKSKKGIKYFLSRDTTEKRFALSVLRILLAYKTGAFKYGIFVVQKAKHESLL